MHKSLRSLLIDTKRTLVPVGSLKNHVRSKQICAVLSNPRVRTRNLARHSYSTLCRGPASSLLGAKDTLCGTRFFTPSNSTALYSDVLEMDTIEFTQYLKANNIRRGFVVLDPVTGEPTASHPHLQALAGYLRGGSPDYLKHEAVFIEIGMRTGNLMAVFVWNTNRGQACGGVRLLSYSTVENFLKDGLRLAHCMGVKSALANLWAGGGQGIVAEPPDKKHLWPEFRQNLFFDFGDFLSSLNGCFVAAEDLGLSIIDMNSIHQRTRYTTCISEDMGGSGSSAVPTAYGVASAMEGALDFLGLGSLSGKSVAIQGCGHVATTLIGHLLDKDVAKIYVTDCNQLRVEDTRDIFAGLAGGRLQVEKVAMDDMSIMSYPCDILSPCALGNCLNSHTIPSIQARIVCGSANNQLSSEEDNQRLADMGIAYVVDFIANRMGIVNCTGEAYGRLPNDPALSRHFSHEYENSIFQMTKKILQRAADDNINSHKAALALADQLIEQQNPIWPNRARHIMKSLQATGWHEGNDFWRSRRAFALNKISK